MAIRAGLIGFGLGGRNFHAPFLQAAGFDLRAIATRRAEEVAAEYPGVEPIADPAALIARPDLDLVAISTPTETHEPLARAALEAGKHVVLDKPFTVEPGEAEELIALSQARGLTLTVLQNRRWDADFLTARGLVADGALGEIRNVQIRFDRFRPSPRPGWRNSTDRGAGVMIDLGAHLVDQAILLAGAPRSVWADLTTQGDGAVAEDGFALYLDCGSARCLLAATPFAAATQPRLVLHGVKGTFIKDGLDVQEEQLKAGLRPGAPGFGIEPPDHAGRLTTAEGTITVPTAAGRYIDFWMALRRALETGGAPPVDPRDSLLGLRVLDAARRSFATGRRIDL